MAQADKNYGSALYARILIYMREVGTPQSVRDVCQKLFSNDTDLNARNRVLNVLNNLHKSHLLAREMRPTTQKSVQKYVYTYIDEL